MIDILIKSKLFNNLKEKEISFIKEKFLKLRNYNKNEELFSKRDNPEHMFILIQGSILIVNYDNFGNREILSNIDKPGELFGEVYLYLNDESFEHTAIANVDTKVFLIDKEFFKAMYDEKNNLGFKIIKNYIEILSEKLLFFNKKTRILSGSNIRQKICRYIVINEKEISNNSFTIPFNREKFANFLAITRPSLSRELFLMEDESFFTIDKNTLKNINIDKIKANI